MNHTFRDLAASLAFYRATPCQPAPGQMASVLPTVVFDAQHAALIHAGYRFLTRPLACPKACTTARPPAGATT